MPIYEYECRGCGEAFSVLKLGSSEVDTSCPRCKRDDTHKKVSSFCSIGSGGSGEFIGGGGTMGGGGG
jgi:putative FmdB family regulatory protein